MTDLHEPPESLHSYPDELPPPRRRGDVNMVGLLSDGVLDLADDRGAFADRLADLSGVVELGPVDQEAGESSRIVSLATPGRFSRSVVTCLATSSSLVNSRTTRSRLPGAIWAAAAGRDSRSTVTREATSSSRVSGCLGNLVIKRLKGWRRA